MLFENVLPMLRAGHIVKRLSRPGVLIALEQGVVIDADSVPPCFRAQAVQARELYQSPQFVSLWDDVVMPYSFTAEDVLASDWFESEYIPKRGQDGHDLYVEMLEKQLGHK